jgi:hypothetical protein
VSRHSHFGENGCDDRRRHLQGETEAVPDIAAMGQDLQGLKLIGLFKEEDHEDLYGKPINN